MRRPLTLCAVALLTGCASQIMESYIGKDVRTAYADYGPPQKIFDMPDGKKAFQWVMTSTQTSPTYTRTEGNIDTNSYMYGNSVTSNSDIYATSTTIGGNTQIKQCFYTLYAAWDDGSNGWVVTNYESPRLGCL